MKKFIAVLSLLIVLMCGSSFAAEVIDTDKTIKVNKYITDSIDSKDEADCFYFDLSKQGSIQIEFQFDVKGKYYARVYDLNLGKEIQYKEFYVDYNTTSGEETLFGDKLRVKAGEYGVKVTSNTESTFDEKYKLKVNYVQESKGDYEVEENNTAKDSMEIETNETVTGNLQWNKDEDYYMFDIQYPGKLQLNFEFNYNGAYNVVLYQQAGTKLEEIQYNVASTGIKPYYGEQFSQSFDKLRVPAGTYYVKVNSKNYSNEDYNLTVLYNIERYGNFEREYNNDIKYPTELYNNVECIGNLNSNKDWDCYVGYMNKGELDLELNVPENAIYRIEVWKEKDNGDDIEFVTKKDVKKGDSNFEDIQIEEAKRYYLGVHCVKYSNEDYTIKFMNNISTPTYQGATQIDLQIGNQYMNVNGVGRLIDNNGTMPVLSNGRTMLPIRAVIEALGGTIEWDANTFTTTVSIGSKNIKIKIGDKVAYVNGTSKSLDVPAQLINQRTMLPLRFIMENLGGNVTWEDATQIVRIKY